MARFKLLTGQHTVRGRGPDGRPRIYNKGEIIECDADLCALFNTPMSQKFERVEETAKTEARANPKTPTPLSTQMQPAEVKTQQPQQHPAQAQPQQPQKKPQHDADYAAKLNAMTPQELKAHAAEEGVDLKNTSKKDDMIKILLGAG